MHELEPVYTPGLAATSAWLQLAVLVVDGSGSMTLPFEQPDRSVEGYAASVTKAAAVDVATRSLLRRLRESTIESNLDFAFISFNDRVTEHGARERLSRVSLERSYDPTARGVGGTAIHRGIEAAISVVEGFMRDAAQGELGASAVVVLMSDGEEMDDPAKVRSAAARLNAIEGVDLATCLFATRDQPPHGEPLLREIVSRPELYKRVYDTEELRRFFHDSITATGVE